MTKSFKELEAVLKKLFRSCVGLEKILSEEQRILLGKKKDDLEGVVKHKQNQIAQINLLENERQNLVLQLGDRLKLPQEDTTLLLLIDRLSPKDQGRFQKIQNKLRKSVERIAGLNVKNALLLRQRIAYSQNLFSLLTGESSDTYSPSGQLKSSVGDVHVVNQRI